MSDRLFVATRKGVFGIIRRPNGRWEIETASFLGVSSPIVMHDPRDGSLLAALEHGHFGAKVHRSADLGHTWEELASPAYPEKGSPNTPASLGRIPPSTNTSATSWGVRRIGAVRTARPVSFPGYVRRIRNIKHYWSAAVCTAWRFPCRRRPICGLKAGYFAHSRPLTRKKIPRPAVQPVGGFLF